MTENSKSFDSSSEEEINTKKLSINAPESSSPCLPPDSQTIINSPQNDAYLTPDSQTLINPSQSDAYLSPDSQTIINPPQNVQTVINTPQNETEPCLSHTSQTIINQPQQPQTEVNTSSNPHSSDPSYPSHSSASAPTDKQRVSQKLKLFDSSFIAEIEEQEQIAGCLLTCKIGEGGMGIIFKGYHLTLQTPVAIKLLSPKLGYGEDFIQRFYGEARAIAQLDHENIVRVLNVGEERGHYFLIMQFIEGGTLHEVLKNEGPLSTSEAIEFMLQICSGLKEAHKKNIIHRDIKPDNLMITKEKRIKITDFGLARDVKRSGDVTQEGAVLGSPYYMSPEQCEGQSVDLRTDIYSLGVHILSTYFRSAPFYRKLYFRYFNET